MEAYGIGKGRNLRGGKAALPKSHRPGTGPATLPR
jgi:hypothetical protein